MQIKDDRLLSAAGEAIPYVQTPNISKGVAIKPKFLVIHYTAGGSAAGAISWLTNRAAKASAHLVIGRDGAVTQLASFTQRTWHAGRSAWAGLKGLNSHSIGIELDNRGPLNGSEGAWHFHGRPVPDEEVLVAQHANGGPTRGWHRFPDLQIEKALDVARVLVAHYGLRDVVGHDEIAPDRKTDPGPAFPITGFRRLALS